jgi:hypothetical protein
MPKFQGIPAIPNEKIPQWQYDLLSAMKENIEILIGARGPGRATTNDRVGVQAQNFQVMTQVSARGDFINTTAGLNANGAPTVADYIKLLNDVQQLATDVGKIQDALNALLNNMRA